MRGIAKQFGSVQALRDVDFRVEPGEIHALLGENGAGKSTLMHVLYGLARADAGSTEVSHRVLKGGSPREAMQAGLGMVPQHFAQVPRMTVAENVWLGRPGVRFERRRAEEAVRRVSASTGLALDPTAVAGALPVGLRQRLEILKVLSREVRVLILDEPTATLTPREVDDLFAALRRLAGSGIAVVLITHKMREVSSIADRVTILRRGEVALTTRAGALSPEELARAMIGADAASDHVAEALETRLVDERRGAPADAVLRADDVSVRGLHGQPDPVGHVSFEIRAGEIVGVAAVEGNGQRELLRAVAGLWPHTGRVVARGAVGFVPEDRQHEGLIQDFSLAENLALGRLTSFWIDRRALDARARTAIDAFRIQSAGPASPARTLSGGNQQKAVLARVLGADPAVLVAENPTRGLDIRAAADVHAWVRRAARERGLGVLFHSADIDEVLALADRVAVMVAGRWQWVDKRTRAEVGGLMLGGTS
jgi:simple sugar transport system ATP-binding protein